MSRRQYMLLLAVAMISGLIGGSITSWFKDRAIASGPKIIKANEFQLIGKTGKLRAKLGFDLFDSTTSFAPVPGLHFYDAQGGNRISLHLWGLPGSEVSQFQMFSKAGFNLIEIAGVDTATTDRPEMKTNISVWDGKRPASLIWKAP